MRRSPSRSSYRSWSAPAARARGRRPGRGRSASTTRDRRVQRARRSSTAWSPPQRLRGHRPGLHRRPGHRQDGRRHRPGRDDPTDVEALAPAGDGEVWVGDIGDNTESRDDRDRSTRVPVGPGDRVGRGRSYDLVYPDGAARRRDADRPPAHRPAVRRHQGGARRRAVRRADRRSAQTPSTGCGRSATCCRIATDGRSSPTASTSCSATTAGAVYDVPVLEKVDELQLPSQQQGEGLAVDADGTAAQLGGGAARRCCGSPLPARSAGRSRAPAEGFVRRRVPRLPTTGPVRRRRPPSARRLRRRRPRRRPPRRQRAPAQRRALARPASWSSASAPARPGPRAPPPLTLGPIRCRDSPKRFCRFRTRIFVEALGTTPPRRRLRRRWTARAWVTSRGSPSSRATSPGRRSTRSSTPPTARCAAAAASTARSTGRVARRCSRTASRAFPRRAGDRRRRLDDRRRRAGALGDPRGRPEPHRRPDATARCSPPATRGALEVADELGARTVAFPLVSAGVYGWPQARTRSRPPSRRSGRPPTAGRGGPAGRVRPRDVRRRSPRALTSETALPA